MNGTFHALTTVPCTETVRSRYREVSCVISPILGDLNAHPASVMASAITAIPDPHIRLVALTSVVLVFVCFKMSVALGSPNN